MEITFYPNQIKALLRIKPILDTESQLDPGTYNTASGNYTDESETFMVTFKHSDKPGWMKRWYVPDVAIDKIIPLGGLWIQNPILNKTGLAMSIWNGDQDTSKLRRRLEQKVERGTLRPEEKKKLLEAVEQLLREMKLSLK